MPSLTGREKRLYKRRACRSIHTCKLTSPPGIYSHSMAETRARGPTEFYTSALNSDASGRGVPYSGYPGFTLPGCITIYRINGTHRARIRLISGDVTMTAASFSHNHFISSQPSRRPNPLVLQIPPRMKKPTLQALKTHTLTDATFPRQYHPNLSLQILPFKTQNPPSLQRQTPHQPRDHLAIPWHPPKTTSTARLTTSRPKNTLGNARSLTLPHNNKQRHHKHRRFLSRT